MERLDAQEALIAELTEAVKARDQFVAVAAHELRNPLTPIVGQIETLLTLAQRTPGAESIAAGLERLDRLCDAFVKRAVVLLDVARLRSGHFSLDLADVDFAAILRQTVADLTPAADLAGCALQVDIEDGFVGRWDKLAIEQIMDNLLTNALKYGAGRPIAVLLSYDGGTARLTVRDEGIGISKSDQARIFDRFERAVARDTHGGGFGIGLWLSCQLVRAMGGDIAVSSRLGKGATFTVTLPLKAA